MKMVSYDSSMNSLNFGTFKEKELDLFFSICYKMKNEGVNEVVLNFQELKELSNYTKNDLKRFTSDLKGVYKKLLSITMEQETETEIHGFVLFTDYTIKKNERTVSIRVNDKYKYILNDIGKYTKFDLMEFVELKSVYSKNMFKILKQYESNKQNEKWFEIKMEKLKELLSIPNSYKISHIDKVVLTPILEQLKPLFQGLKIEKIKRGVKVDSLKFTWKSKKEKKEDIIEVQPVKRKKATLGEKELQEHEKNIQELEKKEIKNISQEPTIELTKITKKDYEALYNEYLERLGEKHNIYMRKSFDFINKTKYEIIEEVEKKTVFTENDIDESLLVSKTGRKLVGTARKNKIEKLLEEMNK
ncbi:MAG: replication initiation protein [Bacilli bacterium]